DQHTARAVRTTAGQTPDRGPHLTDPAVSDQPVRVRPGTVADAPAAAGLHAQTITEGFLPTLGLPFLSLLYRRIATGPTTFLLVADDASPDRDSHPAAGRPPPAVLGIAAGAEEVR